MQLSKEQIEQLFTFTEKKYVRWYDLQVEVVDHLATHIEDLMENDNSLTFETALNKVYNGFGIFGFAKVVREKEVALEKSTQRLWWRAVGEFFTWPKIALTVCLFMAVAQVCMVVNLDIMKITFGFLYFTVEILMQRKISRMQKANKKLLLLQTGIAYSSTAVFFYNFMLFSKGQTLSPWLFSSFFLFGFIFNVAYYKVYLSMRQMAREQYPEVFVEA